MKTLQTASFERKRSALSLLLFILLFSLFTQSAFGHCDSYDGPVIKDAFKAIAIEKVDPVLKWIEPEHENQISALFSKTISYKSGDPEVYSLLEKHFLETLVRLHREGEGEAYTGLKPAGSTSAIIQMTDAALNDRDLDSLLKKVSRKVEELIREKYAAVASLENSKEESPEQGRAYVAAYVDYTHSIEALHQVLNHAGEAHQQHDLK